MLTGFKDVWPRIIYYLNRFKKNIQNKEILEKEMKKFVDIYILRFNNSSQAAALNIISFIELSPGSLFYEDCFMENEIISECRFKKNFLKRLSHLPILEVFPLKLERISKNIKKFNIDIYYYAGKYDTFMPEEIISDTAKKLNIMDRLIKFENSGHEGFYSEKEVLLNLKKSTLVFTKSRMKKLNEN